MGKATVFATRSHSKPIKVKRDSKEGEPFSGCHGTRREATSERAEALS